MRDRKDILTDLVCLTGSVSQLKDELKSYPWDVEQSLLIVNKADIARILEKFIRDEITADGLVAWADAIECRDDIDFEGELQEIIFEIANPDINGPNSKVRIVEILKSLV